MRSVLKGLGVVLVVILVCFAIVGCSSSALKSIAASPAQVSLTVGGRQQLTVTADVGGKTETVAAKKASYASSDAKIAAVSSDGTIVGVAAGTATITVSYAKEYNKPKTTTVPITVK